MIACFVDIRMKKDGGIFHGNHSKRNAGRRKAGAKAAENRFEILIPKLYREPEETVKEHIFLEKDGELKGLLLAQTMTWNVDGRELLTGHIGTVCAAWDYREHGVMSRLMPAAIEKLEKAGCVCIVLNGQRQRYEHFGFIPTGSKTEFVFNPANVKGEPTEGYELRDFTAEDLEETVAIAELRLADGKYLKPLLKRLFEKGFSQAMINIAPGTEEQADRAAGRGSKTFDRGSWTFGDKRNGRGRKSPYMRRSG